MTQFHFLSPTKLPIWIHATLTAISFGGFQLSKAILDKSYAASQHPVDFATGQTAFSADQLEIWYGAMERQGTLGIYWQTQFIDFGFIASIMVMGWLLGTLLFRLAAPNNGIGFWAQRLSLATAVLACSGAGFDIVENLISFVLLQTPAQINQSLAIAYSSAAVAKFALLTLAMVAAFLSLALGLASHIRSRTHAV